MGSMKKILLLSALLLLSLFSAAVDAQNLTITVSQNTTVSFINTRSNLSVLNFTVVADNAHVNITGLNITLRGTANGTDVSKVFVFNATTSGLLVGSNTSISPNLTSDQNISVSFSTPLLLPNRNQTAILVVYEIASNANRGRTVGGEIKATGALSANHTVVANVSLPNSTLSQIQVVHANATISPRFVDTSVENQTFFYLFNITGLDSVTNFSINLPSGYTLINLTAVERGGSPPANLTPGSDYTNTTLSNQVNVSLVSVTTQYVKIYFLANTSSTLVSSAAFTSNITGSNLTAVATDAVLGNLTNVTTNNIINLTTVAISKGTAIINGTAAGIGSDYWEFNLAFNFNATVTGALQFRMTNWTDQNNNTISYTACSPSCATIRADINASLNTSKINITNTYDPNHGISMSPTIGNLTTFYLRMIIPAGTTVSQTWSATYFALFRSAP